MRQIVDSRRKRVTILIVLGLMPLLSGCALFDQPPNAAFTFTPAEPVTGAPVSFDASTDPDGIIVQYTWNFGDGESGSNTPLTHAYAAAGTYTVTLTVIDDGGASDSVSLEVTVDASQNGNQNPTAAFTFTPGTPAVGSSVNFDTSNSTDPDGTIVQYAWTFGDGTTGSGVTPTHIYTAAGTYAVTLAVTDNNGATASVLHNVTVGASDNQAPIAEFTASSLRPAATMPVSFDASASTDPDGTIVQYAWNFGDGTTGSGVTTTHIFQNDTGGIVPHTVTLTVTDDGATGSASEAIQVTPGLPPAP